MMRQRRVDVVGLPILERGDDRPKNGRSTRSPHIHPPGYPIGSSKWGRGTARRNQGHGPPTVGRLGTRAGRRPISRSLLEDYEAVPLLWCANQHQNALFHRLL